MNIRNISLAIIAVAAVSPALAGPLPQPASMTACANAFASSMATPGSAPRYKLTVPNDLDFDSSTWIDAQAYTYLMKALDKTGATIARARCYATKNGAVKSIEIERSRSAAPSLAKRY